MTSITTIDCDYMHPRFAAAFLMKEGDEALFVENNTTRSVPILLEKLREQGMRPEQVRYLIITHVHLDHAGGSHALMRACPNATLLAHPRAAPHMIDPSKLIASAKQVYGEAEFLRMYGKIGPIPESRVRIMADGEELRFGSRMLRFIHTRGHANHHFCVFDSGSDGIFTGDSFGLAYPDLQKHGLFIFPSTSPTDFEPAEARLSIDKILASGAGSAFLTHYGEIRDLKGAAAQLKAYLDFVEPIYRKIIETSLGERDAAELESYCRSEVQSYLERQYQDQGGSVDPGFRELLKLDIELNAAGLVFAAGKKRAAAAR